MITRDHYRELAEKCGIPVSDRAIARSAQYLQLLQKWRARISLMSDRGFQEVLQLHLFESFWAAHHFLEDNLSFVDIGSGAGFPGFAATLYRPSLKTLLIESNYKKAVFLETVSKELKVSLEVFPNRAEKFDRWSSTQVASARAVTPSAQLLHLLEKHRVDLLLFHGAGYEPLPANWNAVEKLLFPLSDNRWLTRYTPAPG